MAEHETKSITVEDILRAREIIWNYKPPPLKYCPVCGAWSQPHGHFQWEIDQWQAEKQQSRTI
jgi:hypothetical protein